MHVFAKTDVGLVRKENQDRVKYKKIDDNVVVVVLCDGMGGENAGAEASEVAVNIIFDRIMQNYRQEADDNSIRNLIFSSVNAANSIVFEKSLSDESKVGMGTTCVCGIIKKDIAYIASVGDSRAYLIHDKNITQITNDHTYVRLLLKQGKITKDEIENHPQKNIITRAVGIEERIELDYFEIDLDNNSVIMMCSDGLSNNCSDDLLCEIITNNNFEVASTLLIDIANEQGGKDNITVALAAN